MLVQSRRDEEGFTHGGGPSDWPYLSGPSCINLQGNKKLWRLVFFPNHFLRRRRRRASTHRGVLASSAAVCLFVRVRCCDDAGRRDSATFGDGGSFLLWRMSPPQKPSLSFRRRSYAADPSLCAHACVSPSPPSPHLTPWQGQLKQKVNFSNCCPLTVNRSTLKGKTSSVPLSKRKNNSWPVAFFSLTLRFLSVPVPSLVLAVYFFLCGGVRRGFTSL